MGEILIGTSGFSFDDWVGEVYPKGIKKQDMLPYYERTLGFKTLEVNYTYYAMPSARTMESLAKRTSRDFSFVVKAHKGMTHEKTDNVKEMCRCFRAGIEPLNGNMKALLFQFPYMFVPGDENIAYLQSLREEFDGYEPIVEFRNAKWSDDRYLEMLKKLSFGYCIVDEPKLKGLLPFSPRLTSDTGYFRFHGRNTSWFKGPLEVRYDYLYSENELRQFVAPIRDIAYRASTTYVFFNNCHGGKAVKNALMMIEMLKNSE
jgi:uncharacterized protein YecE (DUF72 family)